VINYLENVSFDREMKKDDLMSSVSVPRWLTWAREIQALSQISDHYVENEFQRQRFSRLTEIAAEIIDEHTSLDYEPVLDNFQAQTGYATPRVDVRGAVFKNDKILLVQELMDGGWTMPGGWADVGDIPSEAAMREVLEEAGFHVRVRKVVGVYDANRLGPLELFHAFKIIFLCDIVSGEARTSNETSDVRFFASDELPQNFSGERTKPRQIEDAFAAYKDPDWRTVFD
jgi:ADP-ribose pyrophosphatase YjhB (NUDIX family)